MPDDCGSFRPHLYIVMARWFQSPNWSRF